MSGTIYVASKTKHAALWRAFRDAGYPIAASWIDLPVDKTGRELDHAQLWRDNIAESSAARVTIFYGEPGEEHKGSLVEVGASLANGKWVYAVGDPPGTWPGHPRVKRFESVADAFAAAAELIRTDAADGSENLKRRSRVASTSGSPTEKP